MVGTRVAVKGGLLLRKGEVERIDKQAHVSNCLPRLIARRVRTVVHLRSPSLFLVYLLVCPAVGEPEPAPLVVTLLESLALGFVARTAPLAEGSAAAVGGLLLQSFESCPLLLHQ
jgi:hypothetical protein